MSRKCVRATAACAALALIAGCGGEGSGGSALSGAAASRSTPATPREAIQQLSNEMHAAAKRSDFGSYCDRLTLAAQGEILRAGLLYGISGDCQEVLQEVSKHQRLDSNQGAKLTGITVTGDTATATAADGDEVAFTRVRGRWLVETDPASE